MELAARVVREHGLPDLVVNNAGCYYIQQFRCEAECVWCSAANQPSASQLVFTITDKAPTRPFSWLKVPTIAFTFKDTTLNGYVDVKLGRQCKGHIIVS